MSKLAEELIRENLKTKAPLLDLGNCELKGNEPCLEQLGECEHLRDLSFKNKENISKNRDFWTLYQRRNHLEVLPRLPINLTHLDISSVRSPDFKQLATLSKLTNLVLSNTNATDFSYLPSLSQLTHLDLSNNNIANLSSLPLFSLNHLKHLNLGGNKITDPTPLNKLHQLESLNLSNNQIDDPKAFGKFQEALEVLAQIATNLTEFKDQAQEKAVQQFLNTYEQYLNSETRDQFIHIESQKTFAAIPEIGQFVIKLGAYSPYITILQHIVSDNPFIYRKSTKNFNLKFLGLRKLDKLNLSNNHITDFSSISLPKNISELNLKGNFIEEVTLSGFTKLKTLQLNDNYLASFNLNNCNALTRLHLEDNELKQVSSAQLSRLPRLDELFLKDNPIQNIPQEIYNKGGNVLEAVKNYFRAQAQGSILNTQAKVIWVGNGEVGKTTLSHQLRHNKYKPSKERTHGIWVDDWVINYQALPQELQEKFTRVKQENTEDDISIPKNLHLKMWDFGGQEYYHATHRLFLSSNALYVLVWDEANNQQSENKAKEVRTYPKDYWRKNIAYHAPKNVVLEVQNKAKALYAVDLEALKLKVGYREEANQPSIAQYRLDIQQLKKSLLAQLPALEYLGRPFPIVYDYIRQVLESSKQPDFLRFEA